MREATKLPFSSIKWCLTFKQLFLEQKKQKKALQWSLKARQELIFKLKLWLEESLAAQVTLMDAFDTRLNEQQAMKKYKIKKKNTNKRNAVRSVF